MAFEAANLSLLDGGVNGFGLYRYDTLDDLTTVSADGYINNDDDDVNLRVGDILEVVQWNTAVRTGTLNSVGRMVVVTVNANNAVDLSTSFSGGPITDTN